MSHYFDSVPKLGNVAVSRHAKDRMREADISQHAFETVLYQGRIVPDGHGILFRELNGIRLVIEEYPKPFRGAKLVKTVYRIESNHVLR